jgi:2-furoate---CoA ligase
VVVDLATMLLNAADRYPDAMALVDGGRSCTYQQWATRVLGLADGLARLGVSKGDRVSIGMQNSADHATAFFAAQTMGAVAVPFNFRMKPDGIAHVLQDSGATVLITDASVPPEAAAQVSAGSGARWIDASGAGGGSLRLEDVVASGEARPGDRIDPDDLSAILYTSGTTGRPKGVPLTHRNAYERVVSYVASAGPAFGSGVRSLGAAPLYHTVGQHWVLCLTVYLNGCYHPLSDLAQRAMSECISRNELTLLFGSPTLYHKLLDGDAGRTYPSVTDVAFGSAPMDAGLLEEMTAAFPNASINEVFGTTEISIPFVTKDVTGRPLGALRMTADHRVRIVDPDADDDRPVADGVVGELLVDMRNEASFRGYWGAPDKTARSVRDGWYHTGDAFERDAEGNYYIRGRLDDMFISGGENIMPLEVEQVLLGHPSVLDAAVIGTPDPRWGNVVTAYLEVGEPMTPEQVDAYCRNSPLDDFKRPRRIIFLDAIPRNPSGKIVRSELRALYQERVADGGARPAMA